MLSPFLSIILTSFVIRTEKVLYIFLVFNSRQLHFPSHFKLQSCPKYFAQSKEI